MLISHFWFHGEIMFSSLTHFFSWKIIGILVCILASSRTPKAPHFVCHHRFLCVKLLSFKSQNGQFFIELLIFVCWNPSIHSKLFRAKITIILLNCMEFLPFLTSTYRKKLEIYHRILLFVKFYNNKNRNKVCYLFLDS